MTTVDPLDDYPRQAARTRNFSLGVPRSFIVAPDGSRVVFLRTRAGDDPVSCLWVLDVGTGAERLVFDPRSHAYEEDGSALSPAERTRRERVREQAGGVVAYATDREVRRAVFGLGGRLFLANLADGEVRELHPPPVDDPRLDPTGTRVAYVIGGCLHVMEIDGVNRVLAADDEPDVSWGLPEFVAAEEMGRHRGHWWSPEGTHIAAARVDERPVGVWHIGDPTDPAAEPRAVRYPAAGTENAAVTLSVFDVATGDRMDIEWDWAAFPYLARVDWSESAPLTLLVQSRDQQVARVLEADHQSGKTAVVREVADPAWVDLPPDSPTRLSDGRLVHVVTADGAGRVLIGDELATPPGLHVRQVLGTRDDVVFTASEEPTEVHVWRGAPGQPPERLTDQPGVHAAAVGGDVLVVTSTTEEDVLPRTEVRRGGRP
ncbi:MAG TPA: DPP IV N-terminal domain-containing protein, partial [Actinomycetota bacterium]